ncbi:MAG: IPT/TIG domain-containing protein, partial [Candidatus Dormibacteria bacterium]
MLVTVFGISANAGTFTVFPTPVILSVSPGSAVAGTPITIAGSGFGASQGSGGVQFPGNCCFTTATSWSDTQIVIPVPSPASSGNIIVYASEGLFQTTGPSNEVFFTVLPNITNLSPASGTVATSIQINGTGFGYDQSTGTVTFNGVAANPVSWSPTQIVTYPPVGATTGNVVVTVSGNPSAGVNFTVQSSPAISGLTPTNGVVGTVVTIAGTGFGTSQGSSTVTFNGTTASPSVWGNNGITVPVPTGTTTGNVLVTVGGVTSNSISFTLDPQPSISSLSQTSGSIGTSITISGSNFLDTQGSSTVTFNGVAATPFFWSANSIGVNVPTGGTTGNVVVTVLGQASAGVRFTVTASPNISSLSPSTGPAGILVTINGSNFGSSQGVSSVTFNGFPATPTSWASGIIVTIVPEGASSGPVLVTVNNGPSNGPTFTLTSGPGITSLSPTSGGIGATVSISGAGFGAAQGS